MSFRIACVVFVLLTFSSSLLLRLKGFLVGNVVDPGGAVIAGANVKITNTAIVTRDTVSGPDRPFVWMRLILALIELR